MRRLYLGVCVPRMLYAADIFLSPPPLNRTLYGRSMGCRQRGIVRKLRSIQRRAALAITGALRSTAGEVLDIYANLLPVEHLIEKVRAGAALRIATLPTSHPLHQAARREAALKRPRHPSPLHDLMADFALRPNRMEQLKAVRFPATWLPQIRTSILSSKEDAVEAAKSDPSTYQVYTDGSGIDGQIGASAVLYKRGIEVNTLRFHLGSDEQHTVFEGEGVGGCLAIHLLTQLETLQGPVSIYVDSQPAIRATQTLTSTPSHWIWDLWHDLAAALVDRHPTVEVTIRWSPGHVGITGNERADEEAKRAAQERSSSPKDHLPARLWRTLPWSRSATKQLLDAERKTNVQKDWVASTRHKKTMAFDPKLAKGSYITLADSLPRSLAVLVLQLRTGHVPLAKHLHRIRKADSPICPLCRQADESVGHFLLWCPHHAAARQLLYSAAGPDSLALHRLLGTGNILPHLLRFLGRTGRFRSVHGALPPPPDPEKPPPRETFNFLAHFRMPQRITRDADPFNDPRAPPGLLEAWAAMQLENVRDDQIPLPA
ncbi:RNA-directed DNA polymerase from transposon X-element [Mycena sanguinolenta]|uniref:ribonuclease H n=1 Tax=Mycena sanguinolenta TaxID=230812 RepID=A0A8H6X8B2_9AGAR|nr:RNA-directed DNA polymerase from transposon X-element [Mycena sanguinolenta]